MAKPTELKTHAYPVLTARISEAELLTWFPVVFQHVTDPQEAPEPSKAALIKLDAGDYFVVYYGDLSKQLVLRIPPTTDASDFLSSFFQEVPLPIARIVWRREDARLPLDVAAGPIRIPTTRSTTPDPTAKRASLKGRRCRTRG